MNKKFVDAILAQAKPPLTLPELAKKVRVTERYLEGALRSNRIGWSLAQRMSKHAPLIMTAILTEGSGTPKKRRGG